MTRITNFGRKRTHVEATFNYNEADSEDSNTESSLEGAAGEFTAVVTNAGGIDTTGDGRDVDGQPPKKKRKRGPRKKAGAKVMTGTTDGGEGGELDGEGVEEKSIETSKPKGKKSKAKLRSLKGSPPLVTFSYLNFTQTPSRTQRSLGKTTPQANNRAERKYHLFRLSREGSRRTGLPQNRRWIHQTPRNPKRFQCDWGRGDLLSLRFTKTQTLSLSREGLGSFKPSSVRFVFRV